MKLIYTDNCLLTNKTIHGCIQVQVLSSSTGFKNGVFCFSRNYHVFYYLLLGASEEERKEFKLLPPEDYSYLKQVHPIVLIQTGHCVWFDI